MKCTEDPRIRDASAEPPSPEFAAMVGEGYCPNGARLIKRWFWSTHHQETISGGECAGCERIWRLDGQFLQCFIPED